MIKLNRSKFGNWPSGPRSHLCSFFQPGFMGGGGAVSDYSIANALRSREVNSAYLSRTPSSTTSVTQWTYSVWVKRSNLGTGQAIFSASSANSNTACLEVAFDTNDNLYISGWSTTWRTTTQVFRDTTAWQHIVVVWDTPNATASNRVRLYVNGVEVTSFSTNNDPGSSAVGPVNNSAATHFVGRRPDTTGRYFNGNFAEPRLIDGQVLTPSSFGETSPLTGEWVPKRYTGTYGTNGFFLEFKDASAATAAAIGKDTSGNGNNFTPSGISVTAGSTFDQSTDTPTNNHAVINTTNSTGVSVTNGARSFGYGSASYQGATLTQPITFKTYIEIKLDQTISSGTSIYPGVKSTGALDVSSYLASGSATEYAFGVSNSVAYAGNNGVQTSHGSAPSGTILQYAIDPVSGKIWFGINNTWIDSGNPSAGTSPKFTGLASKLWFYVQAYNTGSGAATINTGQAPFVYTPPTGFLALNTYNLAVPSIPKATNGFVSAVDTEANIIATLAAARTGWSAYVDILKNRSNSETWAWRFSHDSSNEHAASTTDTYQATSARTMSGSDNWVGHSIRIGSTYGTAAGSQAHTNGAATTITHNLGNARCFIMLFPRAGGTIYTYHADMTAGSLCTLTSTAAQSASTIITNVGANSFQIGSGQATGTYDYLVISEVTGFSVIDKYVGNASADGPFYAGPASPAMVMGKNISATASWLMVDAARDTSNVVKSSLSPDTSSAESTATNRLDFAATGFKVRDSNSLINGSGNTVVFVAFAKTPAKYSNAR